MPYLDSEARARASVLLVALAVLLLAAWGVGELARVALQPIDLHTVREVAEERTGALTWIARPVSFVGGAPFVVALAAAACLLLIVCGRPRAAGAIALSVAGAAVIVNVVKLIVARPRPPVEHLQAATHSSFPSGHATLSSALYAALLLILLSRRPPRWVAIAALAATTALIVAIGFSRVYLGVHYPTDVIAGSLLGCTWSLLVAWRLPPAGPRSDKPTNRRPGRPPI